VKKSTYAEYGNWGPGLADFPPRSRLYPLTPVGTGTAQAECLTSYLMRLAAAHCLSPGTLYSHEIYPLVRAETANPSRQLRPGSPKVIGAIRAAHCWNGADKSASSLVHALERLTCVQGLHLLTWLPWEAVLSRQFLIRNQRAWCPKCLSQWRSENQTIYEPLLWTLQAVKICEIHECALAEVCPFCQQSLRTLTSNVRVGHCSRCQRWLGNSGKYQRSSKCIRENGLLQEQRWIVRSIGELVARAPELPNSLSTKWIMDNLEEIIGRLINVTGPTFTELAGARYKIFSFLQGKRAIFRLEFILKLCYRLDLSVADFMTAMIGKLSCGIQLGETRFQSLKAPGRREADVRQALEAALLEEPPPPLSEIAERLGYASTNHLHRKYEEMSQRIIARYQMTGGSYHSTQPSPDKKQSYRLRRLLEQELSEADPRHPGILAKRAGYKMASKAERQCPELWRRLLDEHRKYKKEERRIQHERERQLIVAALNEEPAPIMKEVLRRLGYRSEQTFRSRFPEEYRAIRERRAQGKEKRLEAMEAKLREALNEEPPRPLKQVADSLHRDRSELYLYWGELCRAIAARYIEYKKECARKKRLILEEQVRQIVLELNQRGLHPTRERVILLLHNPPMTSFVALTEVLREIREELNLPTL